MLLEIVSLFTCVSFVSLGLIVLLRGKGKVASACAVVCLLFAAWTISLYFYGHPIIFSSFVWIKIVYSVVFALVGAMLYFGFVFPVEPKKPPLLPIFYILSCLSPAFIFFGSLLFGLKM